MNKRQRKKKYPKTCKECSVFTLIKEMGFLTNNICGACTHREVANTEVKKNWKRTINS